MMAKKVKYLYLTVPTDKELEQQVSTLNFKDEYALKRTQEFYYNLLSKNFTFISSRILESKTYFDNDTTSITDLLFRF